MSRYPSADQVAHAIVAATRECDEDAFELMAGAAGKARIYAFVAIKHLFPRSGIMAMAERFGAKVPATLLGAGNTAPRSKWWDGAILARVKAAVPALADAVIAAEPKPDSSCIATPASPAPPAPLIPSRRAVRMPAAPRDFGGSHPTSAVVEVRRSASAFPVINLNPLVRRLPPQRSTIDVTAALMGDPPADRSALYQRQQEGSQP